MKISWWKTTVIIAMFLIADMSDVLGINRFHPELIVTETSKEKILAWSRIPWLAFYEVEVSSNPPDSLSTNQPSPYRIDTYRQMSNSFTIRQEFPITTYWRVIGMSLRQTPLGVYSNWIAIDPAKPGMAQTVGKIKPVPTITYPNHAPAGKNPLLMWEPVAGAVFYELEFLSRPPENPNGTELSKFSLWSTREVFKNGYIADLSWLRADTVYWRVRALDYSGKALGVFSNAEMMRVDQRIRLPLKPHLSVKFNDNGAPTPLYPVYAWIPVPGAVTYEVEVLSRPPENPYGIEPSRYRIWRGEGKGYDLYDDTARNVEGTYYWRVRGLDENRKPVGVYSDVGVSKSYSKSEGE